MRKYRGAIFDLDGTLLDTLEDLKNSVNAALKMGGCPERSLEEISGFVGNGILKLMERAIPQGKKHPQFEQMFQTFKEDYAKNCKNKTRPYEGIPELIKKLQQAGMKVAIVSNKADFAVKELNQFYFSGMHLIAEGEQAEIRKKPAPDMVIRAAEEMGIALEETVYIGDSEVDIQTAANSGIPCISVTWGFRSREFLLSQGAGEVVDTVDELEAHLLFWKAEEKAETEIDSPRRKRYTGITQMTDNPYLNMYHIDAVAKSGKKFDYYFASRNSADTIKHKTHSMTPEGIAIYAVTGEDKLVLVRQYRYPVNDMLYELPAGLVDKGETPEEAAVREMKEETGLTLTITQQGNPNLRRPFFLAQGLTDETGAMIFGTATGSISQEQLEDSEELQVILADKTEVRRILGEERTTIRAAFMMLQYLQSEPDNPFGFLDC